MIQQFGPTQFNPWNAYPSFPTSTAPQVPFFPTASLGINYMYSLLESLNNLFQGFGGFLGHQPNEQQFVQGRHKKDDIEIRTNGGHDTQVVKAKKGNDKIVARSGDGNDLQILRGQRGRDTIKANSGRGNDVQILGGGRGQDDLRARAGDGQDFQKLRGRRGDDTLRATGGQGDDRALLKGGRGNDKIVFRVSDGNDVANIDGGKGKDRLVINGSDKNYTLVDGEGQVVFQNGDQPGTLISVDGIEKIRINGQGSTRVFKQGENGFVRTLDTTIIREPAPPEFTTADQQK